MEGFGAGFVIIRHKYEINIFHFHHFNMNHENRIKAKTEVGRLPFNSTHTHTFKKNWFDPLNGPHPYV